jgi:hypothetical protein
MDNLYYNYLPEGYKRGGKNLGMQIDPTKLVKMKKKKRPRTS